jgi:hypothetical protein
MMMANSYEKFPWLKMEKLTTNHWISNPQSALLQEIRPALIINKYGY